ADHWAAVVRRADGRTVIRGDSNHRFRWASVTKLATALTALIAVERGLIDLDEPAGPPDSTVRHLLAHASGLPFEGETTLAAPGTRRIYSNPGFDLLGAIVGERTGRSFEVTLREWILVPLGMDGAQLVERPSQGLVGSIGDLAALAAELQHPTVVSAETFRTATSVAFPGLIGVVPGLGRFDPCDWALGPELHDGKAPHWMGARNSAAAFGHFGGAGTFLWVDPEAGLAVGALSDREFGPWARIVWPAFSDALLAADR
ncbi:MAG: beta-lactamase family protein, partial [Chloroflexi bacterium]|nr:beta-lactamase family protein [Chloroflexota bacterium]